MRQLIESLENMSLPATSSRAMNVVRGRVARRKRHVWMLAAYLATVCASTFFFFGPNVGAFSVALSVGAMIAELFMKRRFDRRVADRAQQKDDLFAKMRAETEKQIAYLERNVLWLFLLAIGGLNAHSLWNEASVTSWYGIAVTVVLAGGLLYGQRVRLPRLRRELAELSTENEGADG